MEKLTRHGDEYEIVRLHEDDWETFAALRLEALRADPQAFGASFETEKQRAEAHWRRVLADDEFAVFAALHGPEAVGVGVIRLDKDHPERTHAKVLATWLKPEHRGKGVAAQLYAERLAWARAHPTVAVVSASHRASNDASRRAYARHAFTFSHAEPRTWPDGGSEDELFYSLRVKESHADAGRLAG